MSEITLSLTAHIPGYAGTPEAYAVISDEGLEDFLEYREIHQAFAEG